MLLIHEAIRLPCSIAAVCLYSRVYIVFAISFSGIYPFKRFMYKMHSMVKAMTFYNHHHLVKNFWNQTLVSFLIFVLPKSSDTERNLVGFTDLNKSIAGALTQLTLRNCTSNRLRERDW